MNRFLIQETLLNLYQSRLNILANSEAIQDRIQILVMLSFYKTLKELKKG